MPPEGWIETTLGEVATLNRGISYRGEDYGDSSDGVPFYTLNAVRPHGGLKQGGMKFYRASIRPQHRVESGDLLIANTDLTRDRNILGSPLLVPEKEGAAGGFSHHLTVVRLQRGRALPGYMFALLQSRGAREYMASISRGSTVVMLDSAGVKRLPVLLPPLAEQRRIVDLLDAVDAAIDAARQQQEATRSVLSQSIDAELTGEMSGPLRALESLAEPGGIVGGPFGSDLVSTDYTATGVPVIRGANLGGGGFFSVDDLVFVSEEKAHRLARNQALPGDVVATQRGTLGQVGLVPESPYPKYVISQSQMRLRVDPSQTDPLFVYFALRSRAVLDEIDQRKTATANPHINLSIFKSLRIPLPTISRQRTLAAMWDDGRSAHDAAAQYAAAIADARSALLADLLAGTHRIPESYDRLLEAL